MSYYCSRSDLLTELTAAELLQLTDQDNTGSIDEAELAAALAYADATIDMMLAPAYAVPITPAPAQLVPYAVDLARWRMYDHAAPDEVKRRYDAAIAMLERLASGKAQLPISTETGRPAVDAPDQVFTAALFSKMPMV